MSGTNVADSGGEGDENPLSRDFTFAGLLRFALPTISVMVCMGLYTVADTVFVARYVGEGALSAVNIACPVINLIVGLAAMLASGGSSIIARKMGAGDEDRARRDFTLVIAAGAASGILVALAGLLGLDSIALALGSSEALFPYCSRYLAVTFAFAPVCVLQALFQNLIVTAGRPGLGMAMALCAGATDMALDVLFMGPMRMGIAGAALSNGIGYSLSTVFGLVFFSLGRGSSLRFAKPVADIRVLTECAANGSAELLGQLATAATTFLFNVRMMGLQGETGVAAITILIFSQFLLSSFHLGFSMGVAPIISYNHGSGNAARLRRVLASCLLFAAGSSALIWAAASLFGDGLVSLFTPPDTDLFRLAGGGFRVFAISFLFSGINIFAAAAFTALSDGRIAATISFLRTFGFLTVFMLALPTILGVVGVWLAIPAAESLTFAFSAFCLARIWRRGTRLAAERVAAESGK